MRTGITTFASMVVLAIAATPGVAFSGGQGIECISPADGSSHQSPGVCVKTMGFNGPGQAAQYFTRLGDAGMLPPELAPLYADGKITAGELVDLNCTTPPERAR